jgi:cyclic beta-1,2-glucan synthetase
MAMARLGSGGEISVVNPERRCRGIAEAELDGAGRPKAIPLVDDGGTHYVRLVLEGRKRLVPPVARLGAIALA